MNLHGLTPAQEAALWEMVAAFDCWMTSDPMQRSCAEPAERVRRICATYGILVRQPWRQWRDSMGESVPANIDPEPLEIFDCPGPQRHLELIRELDARDDMLAEAMEEVARLSRDLDLARRASA